MLFYSSQVLLHFDELKVNNKSDSSNSSHFDYNSSFLQSAS